MEKYYVYHCSISEINVTENTVNSIFEAHTDDTTVHRDKNKAVTELRDILDKHCKPCLLAEIERLTRVVTVLDRKVGGVCASTV